MCEPTKSKNAIERISKMNTINSKNITEAILRDLKINIKQLNHIKAKINLLDFRKCLKYKQQLQLGRLLILENINCVKYAY